MLTQFPATLHDPVPHMTAIDHIRRLFDHLTWADGRLLEALRRSDGEPESALREFAHVIGSQETWLSRIQERPAGTAVWPDDDVESVARLAAKTHAAYRGWLDGLTDEDLGREVAYTNSAGQSFTNSVGDILWHVVLHAQYHRGKVNVLLRQSRREPAPVDFIAFVRGVPAATTRG